MPSARPSAFKKGGGGFLRKQDGTIIDISFTTNKPGFGSKPAKGAKASTFQGVYAKLSIAVDGREDLYDTSMLVGSQDDFGITEDGKGLTGTTAIPESLTWGGFMATLANPLGGGDGFDESLFDDSDPEVADYSPIIGARCRFDRRVNAAVTAKYGKIVSKKDPKKLYDRDDLVVDAYYGQVEVDAAPVAKKGAAAKSAPKGRKAAAPVVDIASIAEDTILAILAKAPNGTMTKVRLGAKLTVSLQDQDEAVRGDVKRWAQDNDNLGSIAGVEYDAATQVLTLEAE